MEPTLKNLAVGHKQDPRNIIPSLTTKVEGHKVNWFGSGITKLGRIGEV